MKNVIEAKKGKAIASALLFWVAFLILLVGSGYLSASFPGRLQWLAYGGLGTLAAFGLVKMFSRYEKRSMRGSRLNWEHGSLLRLVAGLLIGAALFIALVLPLVLFTPLHFIAVRGFSGINFMPYLAIIPLALMEEVAFRSYTFIKLNRNFGLRISQVIIAFAFALYHIANGWSIYLALTGPFIWAFIYGLAADWSGGIAMPTGIHIAINLLQTLMGMSAGDAALYRVSIPAGLPNATAGHIEVVRLISAVVILLLTWLLMEFRLRHLRNIVHSRCS